MVKSLSLVSRKKRLEILFATNVYVTTFGCFNACLFLPLHRSFYFFRSDVISAERLIYYVCLTFKSSLGQPWELVCDFTQTATSTQITSRQNWVK